MISEAFSILDRIALVETFRPGSSGDLLVATFSILDRIALVETPNPEGSRDCEFWLSVS